MCCSLHIAITLPHLKRHVAELSLGAGLICALWTCYSRLQNLATYKQNSGKPQQWKTTIHLPHMNLIIFPASACPTSLFKQNKSIVVFHFSACMLQDFCNLLYLFEVRMSPTLNRSSAVCRFGYGDVIEVCNGIIFYFYMRLSQL